MIPKTIHYCWFGKAPKPLLVKSCIESWKKYLPAYTLIEWNEDNATLGNSFAEEAAQKKRWAFVSDYVRLAVLYEHGGIYLDTDMLLTRSLNIFLDNDCFVGRQHDGQINGSIIGAQQHHPFIQLALQQYSEIRFDDHRLMSLAIPIILTKVYNEYITKPDIAKVCVLPSDFFYPYSYEQSLVDKNYLNYIKSDTHAVHLWSSSWFSKKEWAGFSFKQKKYLKATILIAQYTLENPNFILKLPSVAFRNIAKRVNGLFNPTL